MNQHYLPQTYLKSFHISPKNGNVWIYNKKTKKIYYRPSKKIFSKKDFFTLHGAEEALKYYGEKISKDNNKYSMEQELQKMESKIGRILKKLKEQGHIDQNEIKTIIEWAAWIHTVTNAVNNNNIQKLPNHQKTEILIDIFEKILPIFESKNWKIGIAEKKENLFSSDKPISLFDIKSLNNNINLSNALISFPLTNKTLLIGSPAKKIQFLPCKPVPKEIILLANFLTYSQSEKLVIINDKVEMENFLNYMLNGIQEKHKMAPKQT